MLRRTSRSCEPKRYSASSLASCVLPTPVGPAKRNTPSGRRGSLSPALSSATERSTACTASVWPSSRSPKKRSVSSRSSGIASSTTKRGSRVVAQKRVRTSSGPTRSLAALAASAAVSLSSSMALRGSRCARRNLEASRSVRSHAAGSMGRCSSRSSSSATRPNIQRARSAGGSLHGHEVEPLGEGLVRAQQLLHALGLGLEDEADAPGAQGAEGHGGQGPADDRGQVPDVDDGAGVPAQPAPATPRSSPPPGAGCCAPGCWRRTPPPCARWPAPRPRGPR